MARPGAFLRGIGVDAAHPGHRGALDDAILQADAATTDLLGVDLVPDRPAAVHGRKARVVELRIFAGLTVEESAEVLHVLPDTVMRDWSIAKSSLARELER